MLDPIQHVSDTAFWIAAYRADESRRKDALFCDPLAEVLSQGRGHEIAKKMGRAKTMAWVVAVRTQMIDAMITTAIAQGTDTVLNLGAGLDTRPYRMKLPFNLLWVEADFPKTIEYKESRLKDEKPLCQLERVKIDLSQEGLRQELFSKINSKSGKVLVLTEGVVPYLTNEQVASLSADLAKQSRFQQWILDYTSREFMEQFRKGRFFKQLKKSAPFQFEPENWEDFFKSQGWSVQEIGYLVEEGIRIGRMPPTPLLARLVFLFLPQKVKQRFMRMSGYAVLKRGYVV